MHHKDLTEVEKTLRDVDFPTSVIIDSINSCNYNCKICARRLMTRKHDRMDIATVKKVIDEIALEQANTNFWLVFYGEPLLIKERIYYISDYAYKKGLKNIYLNTNGSLLNDDAVEIIADSSINRVIVSIDAYSEKTYGLMRKAGNRDLVYKNVRNLISRINDVGANIQVVAQIIKSPQTESEIESFTEYWKKTGALVKIKDKINWTELGNEINSSSRIACPWLFTTLPILNNGDAVICGCDYNGKHVIGNVNENTIKQLWNNEHYVIRRNHIEHKWNAIPDICKTCSDWNILGSEML